MNDLFAGLAPECDQCHEGQATHAVGAVNHRLVCSPCLDWGDRRRWWNKQPVQVI